MSLTPAYADFRPRQRARTRIADHLMPDFTSEGIGECAARMHTRGQIEREILFNRYGAPPQYSIWSKPHAH